MGQLYVQCGSRMCGMQNDGLASSSWNECVIWVLVLPIRSNSMTMYLRRFREQLVSATRRYREKPATLYYLHAPTNPLLSSAYFAARPQLNPSLAQRPTTQPHHTTTRRLATHSGPPPSRPPLHYRHFPALLPHEIPTIMLPTRKQ